jgi:AhpD family alkylhydroperoxidase
MADFYVKDAAKHRRKLRHLKPETAQAFANFSEVVFKDGALSSKVKSLIAIAVAHVTQCPWCIDGHAERRAGAHLACHVDRLGDPFVCRTKPKSSSKTERRSG